MQQIQIIGNLAMDAALIQGQNGSDPFVSMKVICNDKKGEVETKVFYEATYKSTGAFNFLKQGKKVYLSGTPTVRAYQTKDGNLAGQIVIRVHTLELL